MGTLVSVNVGLPTDVAWNGRRVYTGMWKRPVVGPRMVRRLNVDGDGQGDLGGHGGESRAVLVYQLDSYRYWSRELDRHDLRPGHFGENFTVEGLPDDEVCIGDRYRIGQAVFEVSQPRVTCYRVGLRLGEPQMAALLVSHHRPGFYFRVITEGQIEAGQDVVKIGSGPEQVTVAEIDGLLYLPGHPRDALERALRIPALSAGWKSSLQNLLSQASATASAPAGNTGLTAAAASPPPDWAGFRPLEVTATRAESRTVRSITLADPDGTPLPPWRAGQSIAVRLPDGDIHEKLIRNYSLSNWPGAGQYRIGVKREIHGTVSTYIHSRVETGGILEVAAPRGTFFLTEAETPVLLISAGIGVTPVLSMLHTLAATDSARQVWWLQAARNQSQHPFAAESRALLNQLRAGRSSVFYSREPIAQLPADAQHGRLSAEVIARLGFPPDGHAYLCGPARFMDEVSAELVKLGFGPAQIHSETFGATSALTPGVAVTSVSPHPPLGAPGAGPRVQFARSGITAPWGPPSASLLEFAEACDVPARWSCRTGVCHNCETALIAGAVDYNLEPLEAPAPGNILLCCTQPASPVVIDL